MDITVSIQSFEQFCYKAKADTESGAGMGAMM